MKWTGFAVKIGGKRILSGYRTVKRPSICFSTTGRRLKTEYIVKSPLQPISIPEVTIPQLIFEKFDEWNDREAVVCGLTGRAHTYGDVRKKSQNFAASLKDLGINKLGVVASLLPNVPEFPVVALGVMDAGMSLSPINFLYTPHEVMNQLLDSKSEAIVTIPERVRAVLEAKELLKTFDKNQGENLKVIVTPTLEGEELTTVQGTISFTELTKRESGQSDKAKNDEIAVIPYSSGTTGLPKGVCLTHKNIVSNLLQMQHKDIYDFPSKDQPPDVIPCILPMFHIYGLVVVALNALCTGSKLVTLPRFEPTFFLKILTDHKASVLFAVPSIVMFIGSSPFVTKEHLRNIRLIATGAAPCAETDIEACKEKAPQARFTQGYGLTECSPGLLYQPLNCENFNSVGVPVPNTEVKIVDITNGDSLPSGRRGEICARGPQIMQGYLNNPVATRESIDNNGWYHTGDIGYYDESGYFYIVDRVKELIKVKSFQVAPAELEELLRTHPAVRDAGVIGVKDSKLGERPVAYVAIHPEITPPDVEELKGFVNTRVAPYKQIEEFIYINNIERSAAGKILRRELKELYLREYSV